MFKSKKIKKLEARIEELRKENSEIAQENYTLKRNKEVNTELLNILKAILYHSVDNQLEISPNSIKMAKRHHIYIDKAFLKDATRIRLLKCENEFKLSEF